jgi:glycosyltransferase involved in cell wall biosynthesis
MQTRPQVRDLLARARIGIVTLHPTGNYVNSQPTKLYEYMSAGLPVVASDFPVWRKVVDGAQCGLLVDPMNPAAIAEALVWLLQHPEEAEAMGRRAQKAVLESYSWEREAAVLAGIYRELLPNRAAAL